VTDPPAAPDPIGPDPADPDPVLPTPVQPSPVRRSSDPLLLILGGVGVGVGFMVDHQVRTGLYVCAVSLLVAALLRLALRTRAAGNLVVRSRHVDVAVLLGAAVAIAVLAAITPFPKSSG
jgi:hypothetical protein